MASNAFDPGPAPPLVGLSTYLERARFGVWDEPAALLPDSYVSAVSRAGGLPVLLPPGPWPPGAVLWALDALVVTGGPDVGPGTYGAAPHPQTDRPRPERDAWETALCREALAGGLPLLAICRGLQILNVSLGGTLHQHLPDVLGHQDHRVAPGQMAPNQVTMAPESRAAAILGTRTEGRCHHHQAIDRLGTGLDAVGFAADGTVEAVEVPGEGFAIGVQWHPEDDPGDDRLFRALLAAASERRSRRQPGRGRPLLAEHP